MAREMPVSELLAALPVKTVVGAPPSSVSSVTDDSRRVEPGGCFVALPGLRQDARRFVPDAVRRGATLIVTEGEALSTMAVAQVPVPSARAPLSRVDALAFDVAVFTNLTQDHLDFHGTLGEYRRAKRRLFELLARSPKPRRTAVINGDDPSGGAMVDGLGLSVLTFGLREGTQVRAVDYASTVEGLRMTADTPAGRLALTSPLIGEHNVMNLLGAVATGLALGLEPAAIGRALATVGAVPGRFEQVRAGQPFLVVVDYAHTPDALERVLTTARKLT